MTITDRAKLAIPLLQAIVEGKTLQTSYAGGSCWCDAVTDDIALKLICESPQYYRIKPAPRQWWQVRDREGNFLADFGNSDAASHYAFSCFGTTVIHVIEAP